MERTSFARMECPVARTLEAIGEWWSILILRDALRGKRRFEEFQASLGIARNMLSRRLKTLVAAGILEKHLYERRPRRYEYRLTDKGRELFPVIALMIGWGNRWAAPKRGPALLMVERESGIPVEPVMFNRVTGREITRRSVTLRPGPGAGAETRALFASLGLAVNSATRHPPGSSAR